MKATKQKKRAARTWPSRQTIEGAAKPAPSKRLRVWWIPQVPGKPFRVEVTSPVEAAKIYVVLSNYDQFQLENRIKGDYCNVGGLEELVDGEWAEWHSDDIAELVRTGALP